MSEFSRLLEENLDGLLALTLGEVAVLESHFELLQRWNRRMNLTALRSAEEIVLRHYCESLGLDFDLALRRSAFHKLAESAQQLPTVTGPKFPYVARLGG